MIQSNQGGFIAELWNIHDWPDLKQTEHVFHFTEDQTEEKHPENRSKDGRTTGLAERHWGRYQVSAEVCVFLSFTTEDLQPKL